MRKQQSKRKRKTKSGLAKLDRKKPAFHATRNYRDRYGNMTEYRKRVAIAHTICKETCCRCLRKFHPNNRKTQVHHTRYLGKKDKLGINYFLLCKPCHQIAHFDTYWVVDSVNPVWESHSVRKFETELQENFRAIVGG